MKNIILTLSSLLILNLSANSGDSLSRRITNFEEKINNINDKIEQIKQGQLTYQIEKDLLKETYSNNYDRINTIITIILGIVGVLGFLGIRDISSIKKEYSNELENLRRVKTQFEVKALNFESEKQKLEESLKDIIKQNDEQNNKIRVLEFKEKIKKLIDDNQLSSALEYCNLGIELSPKDVHLYNSKALVLARLNQFTESKNCFKKALEFEPENLFLVSNYVESLHFSNELNEAKALIEKNKSYFDFNENCKLLPFFGIIEKYFTSNETDFKNHIKTFLDFNNIESTTKYFKNWDLNDAHYFAHYQPDSLKKTILQHIIWYLNGQVSTRTVIEKLDIIPN